MEISELIDAVDIVDFLSQYTELEEKGGEWWGISPLSDPPEKTPSFSVRREEKKFYCFSTGIGGSVITFLKFYYHISTSQAVKMLTDYLGLDESEITASRCRKLNATQVANRFRAPVVTQKESKTKPLSPNIMQQYEHDPEKLAVWRDEGISDAVMERFGVCYDRFADRIVYPIRDPDGNIVNIGGRTLDPDWKEKGLRKYNYYYKWGRMQTIYGLAENRDAIRSSREIILFEGCKSVLKAASWGIDNCGACLTSHLSPDQMKILIKLGCDVVFAFDKDVDIRKDHNIAKLRNYVNVFYLRDRDKLLSEKDSPVDQGEAVFRKLYEGKLRYR